MKRQRLLSRPSVWRTALTATAPETGLQERQGREGWGTTRTGMFTAFPAPLRGIV